MRQSRTKFRRESKGNKFRFIIIFLILLPSISVLFGYLGTKYVIKPILLNNSVLTKEKEIAKLEVKPNKNIKDGNEAPKEVAQEKPKELSQKADVNTFEIQGLDIFSIQVGSFSTKENAQALVNELNINEMGAYIWHNKNYKVMTTSMLDRESLDTFVENVKPKYEEAFVITTNVPQKSIKYEKSDAKCSMLLESQNKRLVEIFRDVSKSIMKSKEKPINITIQKQIDDLEDMKDKLKSEKSTKHIEPIYNEFIKVVDDFTKGLQDGLKEDAKSCIVIQNALMKGLYQYSDFTINIENIINN